MRSLCLLMFCLAAALPAAAAPGETILTIQDPTGVLGRTGAPVSARVDAARLPAPAALGVVEVDAAGKARGRPIPAQLDAAGTLCWLMPPGPQGERRFSVTSSPPAPPALTLKADQERGFYDVAEAGVPVLRYNHGTVPVPQGIDAKYARGDYIQPLHGLAGEVLTEDYPKDHPHHRGVGWSWPVTRWRDEVRDIWAVVGVWARPVAVRRAEAGPVMALLEAESVWKWGDKEPIVREEVVIRAFRRGTAGRFVDVEVSLTALSDRVAIGGRPKGGYGGFGMRGAPVKEQAIASRVDPPDAKPRRSWIDYSGLFTGREGKSGVAIFEHPSNPLYPSEHRTYANLNYVMPAFPGEREVPLSREKPLVLRHRLWIHEGVPDEAALGEVWDAYAM